MLVGSQQQLKMEHKTEENGHACQEERGGGLVQDLCKVKEQLTRSQYWKNQYYDVEAQYITLLKQFQLMLKKMQRVEDRMLRSVNSCHCDWNVILLAIGFEI